MSREESGPTPAEWWEEQAREDLITAKCNLKGQRYYAAAFFSHQVAEKALKSVILRRGQDMPYTHSLKQLLAVCEPPPAVRKAALELAPEYGKAKCPYHARGVPAKLYDEDRAAECIELAEQVLAWALGEAAGRDLTSS